VSLVTSIAEIKQHDRRWWVLAVVVAAQFIFVVDAFIVNVVIPSIRTDLHATTGEIQGVIVLYQIAFATLIIIGGRLGDIRGSKPVFLLGVLGFTLASLWCGLARSGAELVTARAVQGGAAALMIPQVLATIHSLPRRRARPRVRHLRLYPRLWRGGGVWTRRLARHAQSRRSRLENEFLRQCSDRSCPDGHGAVADAIRCRQAGNPVGPDRRGRPASRAALPAAARRGPRVGAVAIRRNGGRSAPTRIDVATGARWIEHGRKGLPLIHLDLLRDRSFATGLAAVFFFTFANISFYLLLTLYMQIALQFSPLQSGSAVLPLAIGFALMSDRGRSGGVSAPFSKDVAPSLSV
jgi:hypothetical protein